MLAAALWIEGVATYAVATHEESLLLLKGSDLLCDSPVRVVGRSEMNMPLSRSGHAAFTWPREHGAGPGLFAMPGRAPQATG